jgi:hypothetical protein
MAGVILNKSRPYVSGGWGRVGLIVVGFVTVAAAQKQFSPLTQPFPHLLHLRFWHTA